MKKLFTLLTLMLLTMAGSQSVMAQSTVDDLVAISSDYTFIADNITSNGTAKLDAGTLYDEGRIFANTGNSVASNKGKSTIDGVEHLNSLRLKNTQDQLVFKVAGPCTVKFYTQSHGSRGIQVGSSEGGTQYGTQEVNTKEWECEIPAASLVYLSSFNGDFFFAGFEVTMKPKTVTFINDAGWSQVKVWAWNDTENFTGGEWPGVDMTLVEGEDNTYTWSTTGDPAYVIFNNGQSGDGNETGTFEFKDGGKYNSTGRIVESNNYTVTFKTDGGWNPVYAYTWTGDEKQLGEWPGTAMTAVEGEDGTFTITVQAEEAPVSIIFHDNKGTQTPDWTFEADKAYEYNLNTYTVTFTTDAGWDDVYAWIWNGSGDNAVNLSEGAWPGDKLEAVDGVYTYSFKAFNAPESILFNGGDDTKKTLDMAFTNGRAYKWNTTLNPLYTLAASEDAIPAGTTVEVKDADDEVVATVTYGVEGGADFAAPTARASEEYAGFINYTGGNGENGQENEGTVYIIKPVYDGNITVGVWLNGGKSFFITEDGTALEGYNGITKSYASSTGFSFDVKAGSEYKVYCTGSKLGFYGFDYTFDKPIVPAEITEVKFACATEWDNDDHQEWQNGWDITLANTEAEPNVYTGQLDLTDDSRDVLFKLKVNGGGDESDNWAGWIGYKNLTIEAGDLDVTGSKDEENANMRMTRTALAYDKYNLTATWTPSVKYSDGWTLKIEGVGIPTGIQNVNNNAANNGVVYNLAGQRVVNAQKGLFIINGNKVVIK